MTPFRALAGPFLPLFTPNRILLIQQPGDDSSLPNPICPQMAGPTSGYSETKPFPLGNGGPTAFLGTLSWSPRPTNQPVPIELQDGPTCSRAPDLDLENRLPAIHLFQKGLPSPHMGFRGSHAVLRVSGLQKSKALCCPVPRSQEPQAPLHLHPPTPTSSKGLVTDPG